MSYVESVPGAPISSNGSLPRVYTVLGAVLRDARESAGLTQEKVASAARLTRTSLTNIEKGRQKVLLDTFVEIAGFLGQTGSQMLSEIETRMAQQPSSRFTLPSNIPSKAQAQIADIIGGQAEPFSHANSPQKIHSRKS